MGFFFILPLIFFSSFFMFFWETFSLVSFVFMYFMIIGYSYEFSLFYFEYLNWFMLLLALVIMTFMYVGNSVFFYEFFSKKFLFLLLFFMLFSVYLLFMCGGMFMFYLTFEFSIIPIFFLICGWGFNFERFSAAFYMMIYTLFFSLPFLIFLCLTIGDLKIMNFFSSFYLKSFSIDCFFSFFSLMMFFVKLPSFFFHLWLPKAHVEAPVIGSMILAGLLLKLGSYGILVYLPFIFFEVSYYVEFIGCWAILGGLYASFICFRQIDIKKMIAYMSISHMGIIMAVMFFSWSFSFWGILVMMIAHGFCSSGMFFLLNSFYERFYSRSLFVLKGGSYILSGLILWFFMIVSCNISAPPSMNFFSELILLFSVSFFSLKVVFFLLTLMFVGSICSFHMYVSMTHGSYLGSYYFENLSVREHLILYYHLIPLSFSFLFF
uniref:NADH-ubiquinone oxidoreductase chain 4 n=1 Tax=Arrenurus rostratus TaxID=3136836 RepID=A0AAU6QE56_9ACAR